MEDRDRTSTHATTSEAADAPALMNQKWGAGVKLTSGHTAMMFTPKREVAVACNVKRTYQVGQKEIIALEFVRYKVSIVALSK
ncbi:unnamed protein product [Heligmosomoides polygyrus]|uniref:Uncharacterized protein n=1 Tax=Heligmosomoides polygyrus TaxID=6339 RepID=A0A183GHB8_HELPZ|nr:unnamed protein product [Heligmosomoides polygyrus]